MEASNIAQSFSGLVVILSVVMLVYNWKSNKSIIYLSVFLVTLAIAIVNYTLFIYGGSVTLYAILLNNTAPIYFLSGPFIYFYVRAVCNNEKSRLTKTDILHFIPFFINLIAIVPYLLTPFSYKLDIAAKLMENYYGYRQYDFMLFYPSYFNNIGRALSLFIYSLISFILLFKTHKKLFGRVSKTSFNQTFFFLFVILLSSTIIGFSHILVAYAYAISGKLENLMHFFIGIISCGLASFVVIPVFILFNPKILYGYSKTSEEHNNSLLNTGKISEPEQEIEPLLKSVEKPKTKVDENSSLYKLSKDIEEYINLSKPFLKSDFSIHDICIHLNVPQHQVHACFSNIFRKNFSDYKKNIRVEYAIHLLKDNKAKNISMEGIGKQSGFASNSNFYTCFKDVTGMTPNQWLKDAGSN